MPVRVPAPHIRVSGFGSQLWHLTPASCWDRLLEVMVLPQVVGLDSLSLLLAAASVLGNKPVHRSSLPMSLFLSVCLSKDKSDKGKYRVLDMNLLKCELPGGSFLFALLMSKSPVSIITWHKGGIQETMSTNEDMTLHLKARYPLSLKTQVQVVFPWGRGKKFGCGFLLCLLLALTSLGRAPGPWEVGPWSQEETWGTEAPPWLLDSLVTWTKISDSSMGSGKWEEAVF